MTDPLGYRDFLALQKNAALVFTDSGGVQEEACLLGTPCVTLRENTERPETLEAGSNVLAGTNPERILASAQLMIYRDEWENPFGSNASERIANIIKALGERE